MSGLPEQEEKGWPLWLWAIIFVAIVALVLGAVKFWPGGGKGQSAQTAQAATSNTASSQLFLRTYEGDADAGHIIVEDRTQDDSVLYREVTVTASEDATPYRITGKDKNGDGEWERIEFQRDAEHGYSVINMADPENPTCESVALDANGQADLPTPEDVAKAKEVLGSADSVIGDQFLVQDKQATVTKDWTKDSEKQVQ